MHNWKPLRAVLVVSVCSSTVAAQSASPTAVPADAPGAADGTGLALLGFLIAALIGAGLLVVAVASLVSVSLIEIFGPFDDRVHLTLPVVVGAVPTAILVLSFGIELLVVLVITEIVALPLAGFLLRRRYRSDA
jgi:hypothetical protein